MLALIVAHFSIFHISNNPNLRGYLCCNAYYFGEFRRYRIAPVHTRFDSVEWFVWDAETTNKDGTHTIIRQCETMEDALNGLI